MTLPERRNGPVPPDKKESRVEGHRWFRTGGRLSRLLETASEAATAAAKTALQVHGAIGYTSGEDLHIWMRRAWSLELALGRSVFHRCRVAAAILAEGARLGPGATLQEHRKARSRKV